MRIGGGFRMRTTSGFVMRMHGGFDANTQASRFSFFVRRALQIALGCACNRHNRNVIDRYIQFERVASGESHELENTWNRHLNPHRCLSSK